ncbi:hypothetical protein F4804DRAFT_318806 [Jackrogersella minutella]|nr:hypothetical protein F4804DRAFT_318806 [Jackrogersella minutella]
MKFPNLRSPFGLLRAAQGYAPVAAPYHDSAASPLYPECSDKESQSDGDLEMIHSTHTRKITKLAVWKLLLLCLSCAGISSFLTALATKKVYLSKTRVPLMKSPIPEFPKEIRVFGWNSTYVEEPNEENNKAWDELLPGGRGFIFVEDGAKYGLEPGLESKWGEIYSVAMFHQMHCLGVMRQSYWRLIRGVLDRDDSLFAEAEEQIKTAHTGHCFDYFRQSIECSADMSLEWPRTEADGRRFQVDGRGIPHVCTSRAALKEYMDVYHFNGSRVTDIAA